MEGEKKKKPKPPPFEELRGGAGDPSLGGFFQTKLVLANFLFMTMVLVYNCRLRALSFERTRD